ncbi:MULTISPECIES: hypothetical protein [Bacteroidaceae]|jgi:hypothetical protein|uniref:hypothetical protein n=1 Tax=Bacteroidaceae TaxID=815 RepID=UPI0025A34862|nr:hypothetical protein [Bacteroides gallinaceum]MDM8209303.1 hypothetical protein [Bacteroides gallinaceum]
MYRQKKCIYLDQFAVSCLESASDGTLWGEIKSKILTLYAQNKIYCPLSCEHLLETSIRDRVHALAHNNFFEQISNNYIFYPVEIITSYEISMYIRQGKIKKHMDGYLTKHRDNAMCSGNTYALAHAFSEEYKKNSQIQYAQLNDIRSINRKYPSVKQKERLLFAKAMRTLAIKKFVEELKKLYYNKRNIFEVSRYGNLSMCKSVDVIFYNLVNRRLFTRKDIELLISELERNGFDNIPSLNIKNELSIISALDNKKTTSNDDIDISRAASGLAFSDYFFTDSQRKMELVSLQFDKRYNTKIFSGKESDLQNFILELEKLSE